MNENKFTGKAGVYAANRPGYPSEIFAFLRDDLGLTPGKSVADVGAGTGIFTRELLKIGLKVRAVEPNPDMRDALMQTVHAYPGSNLTSGNASQTLIQPPHSLDAVTAAQAFHWFDRDGFKKECRRILRPGGTVFLVWYHRDQNDPTLADLFTVNRRYCPRFKGFSGGVKEAEPEQYADFFRDGRVNYREFPHAVTVDAAGFVGRSLSSSYAPVEGDPAYAGYVRELGEVYRKFAGPEGLQLRLVYQVYWGEV